MNNEYEEQASGRSNGSGQSAFVSYAYRDLEIAVEVSSALTQLGVDVRTAEGIQLDSTISQAIIQAVLSATFVCIILSDDAPPPAVMYEAGIASGSQRPLLIVAAPKAADGLSINFISAPIIRYRPGAFDSLKQDLSTYLDNVYPIAAQLTINWKSLQGKQRLASGASVALQEDSTVALVASHLEQAGAVINLESQVGVDRADIEAVFPSLGDAFNPIFVEFKNRPLDSQDGISQLRRFMNAGNSRLGLLVIADPSQELLAAVGNGSGILIISREKLLQWDSGRLVREITSLRNSIVHSA